MASPLQRRKIAPRKRAVGSAARTPRRGMRFDEEFLRSLFNVASIGICLTDEHGYVVEIYPALCELFGYRADALVRTRDEPAARPILDFLHPEPASLSIVRAHRCIEDSRCAH